MTDVTDVTAPAVEVRTTDRDRLVGRVAWATAWFGLVLGPLHALSRYRTSDGKADLDSPLVSGWADPAGDLLSPLLGWADPDVVYTTYGKLWIVVFVGFTAMAFVAHRLRAPRGLEKWVWRVVLTAYVGACVSVLAEYWTQWGTEPNAALDAVFLATLPLVALTMIGSTVLGVTLLVRRFRPRATAVLLAVTLPAAVAITAVTSMGSIVLPIAFAFGILGRRVAGAGRR